jgi:AraC family transcriptional regulator
MHITRSILFDKGLWRIGHVVVRGASPVPGDVELQDEHILVLPMSGLFTKHDGPNHHIVGTPNHAVLIEADRPYRLSYPAGIGDRCLTVRFSDDTLSQLLPIPRFRQRLNACAPLLSPRLMLRRNLLWHRFQSGQWDPIEVDELAGMLVESTLQLLPVDQHSRLHLAGELASVEAVKEAVALQPAHKWSLVGLAKVANVSPFHLSRIFRRMVGASVYDYVLRARLAAALDFLVDTKMDLTSVALEVGFSSHSHFTARFHTFFGMTPTAFRRVANSSVAAERRRIMTADKD